MAAATLVATAFGIIVIIVTAYVLAGGTLLTSEVVTSAQKDMTDIQVKMLGTSFSVVSTTSDGAYCYIQILNNGREPIRDLEYIDVFFFESTNGWSRLSFQDTNPPSGNHWAKNHLSPDTINPNQWDPGETLNISFPYAGTPNAFKIVTANGISNF